MSFYKNKALKITCIVSLIMICFVYHHYLNTDTKQIKFGATYMTMNNTFYKAVNNEIEMLLIIMGMFYILEIQLWILKNKMNKSKTLFL